MKLKINNLTLNAKLAISREDKEKGMMNKRFNETFNAMLFLMDTPQSCFWMKNCIIPLDIIMIDNNVIKKIHHNCPPCTTDNCKRYCGNGNMVLEVEGDTCKKNNIKEGDFLDVNS
jgi:uncharacterized membrane protein (UPF0127 family)